jgi:hypothetical protein
MVRSEPTAEASLAAMRDRNKFGMAMAAMIKMIATTIRSSISEKPFELRILLSNNLRVLGQAPNGYEPDVRMLLVFAWECKLRW